ncbi:TetR/AcrR family transcriptional regulator [Pontibacillus sp. HMF3514]|uniref:TetR/AcrR family transcriptional regulator n=1 Tax=Pontibacillus sp. HMF3514 TaxID=2692425 RepID=UPI001F394409|nr:TetR/AcrR family transcriptional regulator [Pontibacillus sp. HMF3514]
MKAKSNRSPGRPRQNEKKQPTNEMILQSAAQLFLENGYQEVSVDDVADHCNVTKATVYYYFGSKGDLFTETMVQMMLRIREQMDTILQAKKPLKDRLYDVSMAHLSAVGDMDMDGFTREMKNALSAEQMKKVQQAEENMYEALEEAFNEAIDKGEIREVHTKFVAHSFISLLKAGHYHDANGNTIFDSTEKAAKHIIDLFWNGLVE